MDNDVEQTRETAASGTKAAETKARQEAAAQEQNIQAANPPELAPTSSDQNAKTDDTNPEFEVLAEAIEAGEDIDAKLPATGAGENSGATGDAIGAGVRFDRIESQANPSAGFDIEFVPNTLPDPTANTIALPGPTVSEAQTTPIPPEPTSPILKVGSNADDTSSSTVLHVVTPSTSGEITGNLAGDILIGDVGGASFSDSGGIANIILILDTTSSMTAMISFGDSEISRLAGEKLAVESLLNDLANDSPVSDVRVHIIGYGNEAYPVGTFDIKVDGSATEDLQSAVNSVNALNASGGTNYEAALNEAIEWAEDGDNLLSGEQVINQAVFISDGAPNRYYGGDSTVAVLGTGLGFDQNALDHILGNAVSDTVNEVTTLEGIFGPIEGVGIAVDDAAIAVLDQLEDEAPGSSAATNITTAEELIDVVTSLNPFFQLSDVGGDVLIGSDGGDLMFGDSVNTDALADNQGLSSIDGAGWQVFQDLEAGQGNNANWDRSDTIEYLQNNHAVLGQETSGDGGGSRDGGNDIIDAGAGNDVVYGQEGNDVIFGGLGDDLLSGGSGSDTYVWLAGENGFDELTDFNREQGDVLDLSALLIGEESGDLNDYLNFSSDGTNTTLSVDADGSGAGTTEQTIVLDGIDLTEGGMISQADIINNLVADGHLVVDS